MPEYTCHWCSTIYVAKREKPNHLCYACGIKQMEEEIYQLQAKQGPYYERWLEGMRRAKDARKTGKRSIRPA